MKPTNTSSKDQPTGENPQIPQSTPVLPATLNTTGKPNRFLDVVPQAIISSISFNPANSTRGALRLTRGTPGYQWTLADVHIGHGSDCGAILGGHVTYRKYDNGKTEFAMVWPSIGSDFRRSVLDVQKDDSLRAELMEVNKLILSQFTTWQKQRKADGLTSPLTTAAPGTMQADDAMLLDLGLEIGPIPVKEPEASTTPKA